jgi:hypothetical protein
VVNYFPFKGIVDERPYPPTNLSTQTWPKHSIVLDVPVKNLFLTQKGVWIEALFRSGSHSGDDTPHVVLWRGNYYLEDGHHRVVSAALAGHKTIYARVYISLDL